MGRPSPILSVSLEAEFLRQLVNGASFGAQWTRLLQRLERVHQQEWLLVLTQLRLCLETGDLPFSALCEVLPELLDHWAIVKLCLYNDVFVMRKSVSVVDLVSLL